MLATTCRDVGITQGQEWGGKTEGAMAEFTVNPARQDPLKGFNFRVKWDGKYIPGITRVSALIRTTDVVSEREGGNRSNIRHGPGVTQFGPIVLERGLTFDTSFEDWANKVWSLQGNPEVALADYRQKVKTYNVYRCWVCEYQALSVLDALSSNSALESITLANEGWERDVAVTEPVEPS
jgi:phage tail-like protein